MILAVALGTPEVIMTMIIVALVVLIAVLAWAETAIGRMTRARAAAMVDRQGPRAERVLRLATGPERFVNVMLLLILMLQLTEATLVGVLGARLFGPLGLVVATVVNVVVVFVLAEAAPKTWALDHPESAIRAAPLVEFLAGIPPLRWLSAALIRLTNALLPGRGRSAGPYFSDEEIVHFATDLVEADAIDEEERDLIESVLGFGDTLVREVMVPRPEMITVAGDTSLDEAIDLALRRGVTRMPVHEGDADHIATVVNIKDALRQVREGRGDDTVASVAAPVLLVPETIAVNRVLPQMRDARTHMAIVFDEHGGTAGLVTMEDLLEELVGEIEDESDRSEPLALPKGAASMLLRGSLSIDDANEHLEEHLCDGRIDPLPEGDWDSVGGLIVEQLGRPARVGDEVEADGSRLSVREMRGRRIMWVLVESQPDRSEPTDQPLPAASVPVNSSGSTDTDERNDERTPEHGRHTAR